MDFFQHIRLSFFRRLPLYSGDHEFVGFFSMFAFSFMHEMPCIQQTFPS
jgi:hypothetical protein